MVERLIDEQISAAIYLVQQKLTDVDEEARSKSGQMVVPGIVGKFPSELRDRSIFLKGIEMGLRIAAGEIDVKTAIEPEIGEK